MAITFLGTGDAFGAGGRNQAAYLLQASGTSLLLDCGPGTLPALKRAGVDSEAIDCIFLSHLHGDHFGGLPFLFLQYAYAQPRQRPLRIVGPPGSEARVRALYRTMYESTAGALMPFALEFTEILPSRPLFLEQATVQPFFVPHQENDVSFGFLVQSDGRRILYSGDTGWTEDLISLSAETDLFICECSFYETRMWSHLDYPRLAENRSLFETRRLILTHLGSEVLTREDQLEIELAKDGLRLEF